MTQHDQIDRRIAKGEKTKGAILNVARALFSGKGFDGTSVKEITEAAGVPKSLFYHYFESMDELLSTIVEESVLVVAASGPSRIGSETTVKDEYIERVFEFLLDDRENLKIIFGESLRRPGVMQSLLTGLQRISGDLDRALPDLIPVGRDARQLAVLRLYAFFFPLIMLAITEDDVADHFGMDATEVRSLAFSTLRNAAPEAGAKGHHENPGD